MPTKNKKGAATSSSQLPHKFFNMKKVIDLSGINQDKVYNNLKGEYNSLSPEEKNKMASILTAPVKSFFKNLGYACEITKQK